LQNILTHLNKVAGVSQARQYSAREGGGELGVGEPFPSLGKDGSLGINPALSSGDRLFSGSHQLLSRPEGLLSGADSSLGLFSDLFSNGSVIGQRHKAVSVCLGLLQFGDRLFHLSLGIGNLRLRLSDEKFPGSQFGLGFGNGSAENIIIQLS
jgi:hypothetical protein